MRSVSYLKHERSESDCEYEYAQMLTKPSGDICVLSMVSHPFDRVAPLGFSFDGLISDTANEISDREEHPLAEASAKNNRNHNCNGGYAKFNKLPYKYMRAGYEHSKSCRRCDDDEGRTPNTGFAKGRDQYILQSGRELTLLKNTGEATGKRVDSKNISGSDRFTSGGTVLLKLGIKGQ